MNRVKSSMNHRSNRIHQNKSLDQLTFVHFSILFKADFFLNLIGGNPVCIREILK